MSQSAHRHGDARICGATTIVSGQGSVYTNGKLASVNGDINSDGDGALIAQSKGVYIGGKPRVIVTNHAAPDALCPVIGPPHCDPLAQAGSPNVFIGEA